jgi:hypothetical protein
MSVHFGPIAHQDVAGPGAWHESHRKTKLPPCTKLSNDVLPHISQRKSCAKSFIWPNDQHAGARCVSCAAKTKTSHTKLAAGID